jgi:hypothetical protein
MAKDTCFYSLRESSPDLPQGLYFHDVFRPDKKIFLTPCHVGKFSHLDFSYSQQRLVYQKNLNSIEIVPFLHQNAISFLSMPKRKDILAVKQHVNQFVAFTFSGEQYEWDITTGLLN